MKPTDTRNPDYYHKVVDCQRGCPAHTNVPEYIRLIGQGRHTEAYLLNRKTNVFPGILGRVCDRPCEPVCRRGRLDGKPVAICRLKRVAADYRDEVRERLPKAPDQKNGKRIACVGAGCASLTVANDLAPLGYEIVIFEALDRSGGLMRINIPSFRLPARVLDEEIQYILDMGVDLRFESPVESMRDLMDQGFDAIFVGSGAPKGKELNLPGRDQTDRIHIGIEWLESVAFNHIESIGEKVLIIGVGNTAMDCCRTSLRLGGKDVKVMARKPRQFFKASEWELEDAEEERVEIVVNHSPKAFVVEQGVLKGMLFDVMEYDIDDAGKITDSRVVEEKFFPCDDVVLAIGQENAFPWIERDLGMEFDQWERACRRHHDLRVDGAGRVLRWRRGVRPKEHHLGRRARASSRDFDTQPLSGRSSNAAHSRRHGNVEHQNGNPRVELLERLRSVRATPDGARGPAETI